MTKLGETLLIHQTYLIQRYKSPSGQSTAVMVSQAEHSTTGQDQGSALNFREEAGLHTGLVNGDG